MCTIKIKVPIVLKSIQTAHSTSSPLAKPGFCSWSSPGPLNRHVALVLEEDRKGVDPTLGWL